MTDAQIQAWTREYVAVLETRHGPDAALDFETRLWGLIEYLAAKEAVGHGLVEGVRMVRSEPPMEVW